MERNLGLKRKAQELQSAGRLEDALRQWDRILDAGEVDPYDYVTVGDLLLRKGRRDEAREHYEKASEAYQSLGFLRNAIGVTKKILRMGGDNGRVHYLLGNLYLADGLVAEATEHCAAYLAAYADGGHPVDDTIQLLEALREKGVSEPDFSLRLADLYDKEGRRSEAASELLSLADRLPAAGGPYDPQELRERAHELDPSAVPRGGGGGQPADTSGPSGSVPPVQAGFEPSPAPSAEPIWEIPESDGTDGEPPASDDMTWSDAVDELGALLEAKGCRLGFLEKLVEAYRPLGDVKLAVAALDRLARHFDESGDPTQGAAVWQEILSLDPEHPQALKRQASEDWSPQFVVASDKTPPAGIPKLNVEELLRDFQDEMARQIPEDDGESHYALALSHYEMGLYDKALETLELALATRGIDADLELRCRELRERSIAASGSGSKTPRSGESEEAA